MITLAKVKKNKQILEFINKTEAALKKLAYTDHGLRHSTVVSDRALSIAKELELSKEDQEAAGIAAFCHDMGNFLGRTYHHYWAALLFSQVFMEEMDGSSDLATIMQAIVTHDKNEVKIVSKVSAVLILADKSDVHRTRVRKKDIKNIFKYPAEKIKVINVGFDKRLFEESKLTREKVLEKYGIPTDKKYILFLGTIEPIKNITRLLEAFKIFKEKCQKIKGKCEHKLILAGKNGWLAQEYKQIVKDLDLSKDVFFTGYVVGDELVPLFKNADFFVMPSLYEGFGMTVLEAFATGTPAIVSNVSSIPEVAGDAAYQIDPINTQELAEAMTKFATDENLKNDFREKGKKQVEKFNWEKCARETLEVYKSFEKNK